MARLLALTYGGNEPNEAGSLFVGSGFLLMLGMVVMSVSVMSMLIFACADDGSGGQHRPKRRHGGGHLGGHGHFGAHGGDYGGHTGGGAACGGGGGGGGCGGGGGGGGC